MARNYAPKSWDAAVVGQLAAQEDLDLSDEDIAGLLESLKSPQVVLDRAQSEGPGREAVNAQITLYRASFASLRQDLSDYRVSIERAERNLDEAVNRLIAGGGASCQVASLAVIQVERALASRRRRGIRA